MGQIHNGGGGGGGAFRFAGSARFYMYTNNRWVGPSDAYGSLDQNYSGNYLTGTDPATTADAAGFGVFAGDTLKAVTLEADVDNAEVTALDIAIVHMAAAGGLDTVLKKYLAQAVASTKASGLSIFDRLLSPIAIPSNGHLVVSIRPVGTLTATQYAYTGFSLEVQSG